MIMYILRQVQLLKADAIYICDGSVEEAKEIEAKLVERGTIIPLPKLDNW